jgi:hypothetical protein
MKKNIGSCVCLLLLSIASHSQLCPGGGVNFAGVVTFNQSWISGCATGTSCSGGIELDNRSGCEPTTSMDACAPAPTCTSNTNGSDIWFRFYATNTSVTINAIQSVSFIASIQAFSGGPACGGLTQIGCAVAAGPSSGVSLSLSGLTLSQLYYFRIFGSASSAAQRTGVYCFCGSAGVGSIPLPVSLISFNAVANKNNIILNWQTTAEFNNHHFEIERSNNGTDFLFIASLPGQGTIDQLTNYNYTDVNAPDGINFYRLKQIDIDGRYKYSNVAAAKIEYALQLSVFPNPAHAILTVSSKLQTNADIVNQYGQIIIKQILLKKGRNDLGVTQLANGIYFLQVPVTGELYKFTVLH